ncbi:ATP-binding protein [Streptomyces sp. NPDC052040]|uniref:ATP-binding protein n=1 Tax=unclassified Streptomyces TaxID=2593676 RepID=UPI0037D23A03
MKQSAARTLGVAALGAAFAAAGAGVASAAPAVQDITGPDAVAHAVPLGKVTGTVPGAGQVLGRGQHALGTAVPTVGKAAAHGPAAPVGRLLGGLPVSSSPTTRDVPLNGIPLA